MADLNHTDIINRLDRMQGHLDTSHNALAGKIDKLADVTGQNSIALTHLSGRVDGIESELSTMKTSRVELVDWVRKLDGNITASGLESARLAGERGVWAAIVRSPTFGWLAGLAVAAWAYVVNNGSVAK